MARGRTVTIRVVNALSARLREIDFSWLKLERIITRELKKDLADADVQIADRPKEKGGN